MSDLFKKLNLYIKANLGDLMGESRAPLPAAQLGKDIDREIVMLRQRINAALDHETHLQNRVRTLEEEIQRWDTGADEAVVKGSDAVARHAIEQMKHAERRLSMAQNDLDEHRLVTQELIQRVNMLEAAVADARRRQAAESENQPGRAAGTMLSDVLRDAREKIGSLEDTLAAKDAANPPAEAAPAEAVDDDLAQRRQRLSKS
jgi:phage shock protein A